VTTLDRKGGRRSAICCVCAAALLSSGCSPQDAIVGAMPPAGSSGPGDSAGAGWSTQFASNEGRWDEFSPLSGASIAFGRPNAATADNAVVELRLPGQPGVGPNRDVGPDLSTEIATRERLPFGMLRASVSFPTCAPTEEVASAVFAYFNDGRDTNGNGITDDWEINFHVLCGTPTFIVMTNWTDYAPATATEPVRFVKVSRAIDTATGDIYETVADNADGLVKIGNSADLVYPGFPAPGTFYEVGFDWQPSSVRYFIVRGGTELTLWTLSDPKYVPQMSLNFMFNLWHPDSHWVPTPSPADYPAQDAVLRADWASFRPN
jgi:hypothetical protein